MRRLRPLCQEVGEMDFLLLVAWIFVEVEFASGPEKVLGLEFVPVVGDNPHDSAWDENFYGIPDVGVVLYPYRISKYEITREQYLVFLNSIDPYARQKVKIASIDFEIDHTKPPGSMWVLNGAGENLPVEVSWYAAARYVNWLNYWYETGELTGSPSPSEGTDQIGAYDTRFFSDSDFSNDPDSHNPGSFYWLTTFDEWYKAAYWDFAQDVYWQYPNGSPDPPRGGFPDDLASDGNMKVSGFDPEPDRPAPGVKLPVGSYSYTGMYGTKDLCGNVAEWSGDKHWDSWLFDTTDGRHLSGGHSGWYPDHTSRWAQVTFATHRRNPTGRAGIRLSSSVRGILVYPFKLRDLIKGPHGRDR
jgi:formylglycine-generating enzyme required for sulfatase activity